MFQILLVPRHDDGGVKVVVKGRKDIVMNLTEGQMVNTISTKY
jgi:hypothetical protein